MCSSDLLEPRLVVGLAMGFAAAFMALPGALLAILLLVAVHVVGARRSVGARSALLAVGAGLALAFPLLLEALEDLDDVDALLDHGAVLELAFKADEGDVFQRRRTAGAGLFSPRPVCMRQRAA